MLELRPINRNYGIGNFKFTLGYKEFNKKKHNELNEKNELEEMKRIFIPYCENKLHLIATYLFLTKYVFPIIFLLLFFLFPNNIILQMGMPSIGVIISFITNRILNKQWIIQCQNYSFELTAINTSLSEKYGFKVDNDFDELGEQYIKGEL